ncbi:MAG: hypothetical protein AKCLJLPJ_01684 [Fimbriimonadales bacterium]|nr:MAG: DUF3341 domain-containing protein [Armatimonadota bacterium]MBV6503603.1 hypothetical protein [Fimbriimonadales bacterium]MCE7900679.1 DUF3341 domain-containing protein [Armatimonadetes bacterium ATM1]MDL1928559.1 DUF3341 domain-containing protein [Fimbriimonadia bacterium ATM]MBC6970041.1 DUF3341 domain-containing protein [Armatimonadota bacterium]
MSQAVAVKTDLFGIVAQYEDSDQLIEAARRARDAGYTKMDGYAPFAIEELPDILGNRDDRIPWVMFFGGMFGAIGGFGLQVWVANVDYALNIGGRPNISWPSFVPVTFECMVLAAAISGLVGMIALNGLPRPHHPLFDAPDFERVTQDRFFLCIESSDPNFDRDSVAKFLESTGAISVSEVKE